MRNHLGTILAKSNIILLGLTGGIASGKSSVANMLKELGASVIDFDLLARQIVEPDKPAWKEIVDYFGDEILLDDGNIDRKTLSNIVFRNSEKRKKLEGFIHPRASEEFLKHVNEIASKDNEAIILAIVPLLFEVGMRDLFNKVIVVHIPREKQIERLIERDGISIEETINILNAQMPIDEKIEYADFVIHNENSLNETKRQVKDLWQTIIKLRKEKTGRD